MSSSFEKAIDRLRLALEKGVHTTYASFDEDAPVADDLSGDGLVCSVLEHSNLRAYGRKAAEASHVRSRIRYLAALFPSMGRKELAETLHGIVGNPELSPGDVRLIVDGRSLSNPQHKLYELPIETIQAIGALLQAGVPRRRIAATVNASPESVKAIDLYLGIATVRYQNLVAQACDAVRDGTSVRAFARQVNVSNSKAFQALTRARAVLVELGEL
jgi:hypothetical protein